MRPDAIDMARHRSAQLRDVAGGHLRKDQFVFAQRMFRVVRRRCRRRRSVLGRIRTGRLFVACEDDSFGRRKIRGDGNARDGRGAQDRSRFRRRRQNRARRPGSVDTPTERRRCGGCGRRRRRRRAVRRSRPRRCGRASGRPRRWPRRSRPCGEPPGPGGPRWRGRCPPRTGR